MLEQLITLYYTAMEQDIRTPTPHLAGPPGVGKSEAVYRLGEMLGVQVHTVNVARLSPLELEGVQMPHTHEGTGNLYLQLLHSTLWTQLKEGDIVFLDEFMRGFPEVYNGLLDIMTSRQVAGLQLPKVFFCAASNSVAAYDPALTDRLLHIPVKDIRTNTKALTRSAEILLEEAGFYNAKDSSLLYSAQNVVQKVVMPTYVVLDEILGQVEPYQSSSSKKSFEDRPQSVRHLAGQIRMRHVTTQALRPLIELALEKALIGNIRYAVFIPDYFTWAQADVYEALYEKQSAGDFSDWDDEARTQAKINLEIIKMRRAARGKQDSSTPLAG